ncbi:ribose transport system permease protein [Gemmobacter aquatilis]|uniref:Ribose transport system permease protein n=2 Tax=Gemmobacter aquatilis TaxID=933059 RepID=A0A1H7Y8S8_9RHOB|nr:ribose transport system permease protein [Gemmobacter aquatilis]
MSMSLSGPAQPAPQRKRSFARIITNLWLLAALVAMTLAISQQRPQLLDPGNIATVLRSFSIMVIMVLGLTWVIASGKIDVSFMQVAALANMTCAALLQQGWGWGAAIAAAIALGLVVGLVNGGLVARMKLPPLIVTIATAGMCASAAAALGKGTVIRIADPGPLRGLLETTLFGAVPVIVLPVLGLCLLAWYAQERLAMGRYIYAMAQNEAAVVAVGVPVGRIVVLLFALSGASAALAGVLLAANLSSGQPTIGGAYLINGLTVVLLGGMMVHVGKPNILGSVTATLFLGVLFSGAALLGLPDYQRQIIQGALLLTGLAVATGAARMHAHRRKGN